MTDANKKILVLVVDDNPVDQQLAAIHLRSTRFLKDGGELEFARDGKAALAKLGAKRFALVVLDWELPVLGKGEVLRQLRKRGSSIPVVVISGMAQPRISADLEGLKAAYLSKDQMNPDQFQRAITQALALLAIDPAHFRAAQDGK